MTIIPEKCIARLRSRGLFIADPMPPTHVFANGVLIGKPVAVPGNTIPEYRTGFGLSDRIEFDAPPVWLFARDDKWFVLAEDHCPGPGPGDFLDTWDTAEEAVQDILDFYFGDQKRMLAKSTARAQRLQPSQDRDNSKRAST
ncbi:MAG TPA: hypothetical protein PL112_25665 [Candidatus Obscuribacter sp.]|nr:hypothetical protein [Candidatus Obscuribacter sp.]MBK9281655.1 hypothetical protein [Candidatus Obscuribacter sp.]MBL8082555.1 hypothetical protein [Candidatus Obscuribacter sp.]HND70224.1 hypothetical protein [Candidatus Obscuribacter sp.]